MSWIPPLGRYEQLRRWVEADPVQWGPGRNSRARFGADVVVDLVAGLADGRRLVRERFPAKAEPMTLAIGCVPWLTSPEVVDALLALDGCCICVDKSQVDHPEAQRLAEGPGVWQRLLGLDEYGLLSERGEAPWIAPGAPLPGDRVLEAVRSVGWRKQGDQWRPMLHAKLCVVAASWTWENDGGGYDDHLTALRTWVGSANWTVASAKNIEIGAWSDDEALGKAAIDFLKDLILFSEPPDSPTGAPEPQLVAAQWDDDAFAAYAAEYLPDPDEADDDEPWWLD